MQRFAGLLVLVASVVLAVRIDEDDSDLVSDQPSTPPPVKAATGHEHGKHARTHTKHAAHHASKHPQHSHKSEGGAGLEGSEEQLREVHHSTEHHRQRHHHQRHHASLAASESSHPSQRADAADKGVEKEAGQADAKAAVEDEGARFSVPELMKKIPGMETLLGKLNTFLAFLQGKLNQFGMFLQNKWTFLQGELNDFWTVLKDTMDSLVEKLDKFQKPIGDEFWIVGKMVQTLKWLGSTLAAVCRSVVATTKYLFAGVRYLFSSVREHPSTPTVIAISVAVLCKFVLLSVLVAWKVHGVVQQLTSESFGLDVKVETVYVNLLRGVATLKGLRVCNPKGSNCESECLLRADVAFAHLSFRKLLCSRRLITVDALKIPSLEIVVELSSELGPNVAQALAILEGKFGSVKELRQPALRPQDGSARLATLENKYLADKNKDKPLQEFVLNTVEVNNISVVGLVPGGRRMPAAKAFGMSDFEIEDVLSSCYSDEKGVVVFEEVFAVLLGSLLSRIVTEMAEANRSAPMFSGEGKMAYCCW